MTSTLFNLTYRLARELGIVEEGSATGGTTTTVVDSNDRTEADDYFNGGTLWVVRDAGGAGAAPEGEYSVVSDFANATGTVTLRTALTVAPASGDKYAVANQRFPLERLIQSINSAQADLGDIPVTDTTTLDTADNQTEYTLPAAASYDLRQVWIQTQTGDANDNRWNIIPNWYIQRTATGSADLLILPYQYPSGYDLKLVYVDPQPDLHLYSSQLSEAVHPERVIWQAGVYALRWYKGRIWGDTRVIDEELQRFQLKAEEAKRNNKYRIKIPKKMGHMMTIAQSAEDYPLVGEVNKVNLS